MVDDALLTAFVCRSINAFKQLEQQIHDMAVNVCKGELTNDLPDHAMQRMPKGIPDFSSADPASIQIRCYYAESLIARILTERIFQPFLFTLHRRHEVANHLFEETSQKMRQSSPRKEAVWRQQTLHAAYTCSAATNKVAAKIVEEILYEVGPFMAVDASEQLVAAVRLIVKTAAEAWRYAR